jgi:hypothetical protein
MLPALKDTKIEVPHIPFFELLSTESAAPLTCTCCKWKGTEMKARKFYLEVENIAELELYCPKCNQYLGFTSEQLPGQS